jgi:GH15 family glucan-1,4-alpha-glucosidase
VLPRFDTPTCFAALLIPRVGFLPYDDERVVGTIEAISEELTEDGLVLRASSLNYSRR